MTHLVFHGAEHTRFGHSLGVMHLVSKAFKSAVHNSHYAMSNEKIEWYDQILRLIALTHDLGHAPFSHAAEAVFSKGLKHEDFTEKIIKETEIARIIHEIGNEYVMKYGKDYNITPDLIWDIYAGTNTGNQPEFLFLKMFMDSELDCDKMDYLLRDSYYCGVSYGNYDVERLISCLTIYEDNNGNPKLAIDIGGVQAFEGFVLARYFMFIQVYFHHTRRYFDIMYAKALEKILPNGKFPEDTKEYLRWDDNRVMTVMKDQMDYVEECANIIKRKVYPRVLQTKIHPGQSEKEHFQMLQHILSEQIGSDYFIADDSADKMPYRMPSQTEASHQQSILIIDKHTGKATTIWEGSHIIKMLTEKIDIVRIYAHPKYINQALKIVAQQNQPTDF